LLPSNQIRGGEHLMEPIIMVNLPRTLPAKRDMLNLVEPTAELAVST